MFIKLTKGKIRLESVRTLRTSIETALLCNFFEQSDHYSWRYCLSKNWGIQKCRHECSLGVNLVIDNLWYVASDTLPLY